VADNVIVVLLLLLLAVLLIKGIGVFGVNSDIMADHRHMRDASQGGFDERRDLRGRIGGPWVRARSSRARVQASAKRNGGIQILGPPPFSPS
jgi:hypothetical protein